MKLVETNRNVSKKLGHKRRVFVDNAGILYLECNNPKCEEPFKPLESYHKRAKGFKGKRDHCPVCHIASGREWAKEHPEKMKEMVSEWWKNNPERGKQLIDEWHKNNSDKVKEYRKNRKRTYDYKYAKEYYRKNKERQNKANRRWQLENPDKVIANWNKRRARLLNAENTIDTVTAMDNFKDVYGPVCGFTGLPLIQETVEHLLPISRGGGNTEYNLYPAESSLNISKGTHNVFEWIEKRTDIDFSFFFENTLPYLANQKGISVEEFINEYNNKFKDVA